MKYRSEIDGLRAVAVVPVVLFHAGFEVFSGGFVGVDVFFVISGFLITTIIINEMDHGRFSLLNFYERRARRILPALFFVVICCFPFAWILLLPNDLKDFSQSLIAVATFSSNILFWRESGYFESAAELKPLLHTWSLAVEEQFYILFPLFLMVAWRFGRQAIIWTLIAAFAVSLAAAQWGAYNNPGATFYLLPTRAWELLIGSFAAFYLQKRSVTTPLWLSNALSAIGLALILYGVFAFDEMTPFPSLYALAPTAGTVLIILFAVRRTVVHTVLSMPAFVGIGLISYSLYLWHQPVFAFWAHYNVFEPTHVQMAVLSLSCLILAYLTYRFVERPFRKRSGFLNRPRIFAASLAMMILSIGVGISGHLKNGWNLRAGPSGIVFADLEGALAVNPGIHRDCIGHRNIQDILVRSECSNSEKPQILLWGDSYAMHLYGMLAMDPSANALGIVQLALSGCMPNHLIGINSIGTTARECVEFNNQVMRHIEESNYSYVIVSSPFNRVGRVHSDVNGDEYPVNSSQDLVAVLSETARQVEATGAEMIFVAPPPTNGSNLGLCVVGMHWREGDASQCDFPYEHISLDRQKVFGVLSELSDEFDVISLNEALCESGVCRTQLEGVPIYKDTGHISNEGSVLVGRLFNPFEDAFSVE